MLIIVCNSVFGIISCQEFVKEQRKRLTTSNQVLLKPLWQECFHDSNFQSFSQVKEYNWPGCQVWLICHGFNCTLITAHNLLRALVDRKFYCWFIEFYFRQKKGDVNAQFQFDYFDITLTGVAVIKILKQNKKALNPSFYNYEGTPCPYQA